MNISRAAILLFALPAALPAQQPQGGPPTNPITTVLRNRNTALQRNLATAFDSIPESKFGYKPTPAQQSIGFIAQHLASDNYFFCGSFGDMKPALAVEDTATTDSLKARWPKEKLVTKLKASFKFCDDAFAQLDDTKLADQIPITFGGNTQTRTRASMPVGHLLDMADHYSQIANYMRLNNMLPPTALPRPRN